MDRPLRSAPASRFPETCFPLVFSPPSAGRRRAPLCVDENGFAAMNEADALDILHLSIWTILVGAGPAVCAAMVVGILFALFQALTQIQEMTLTFVPKIIIVLIVLSLSGT